jgi:osmotically-inducible protein OsmY
MNRRTYEDSGHQLSDLVHNVLARSPYFAGRSLSVETRDNEVVLKGVVRTYYQKQMAQESLRGLEQIGRIQNDIEVISI